MSASGVNHGLHKKNKKYKYYDNKAHKLFGQTGNEGAFKGLDEPHPAETVVNTVKNSGKWGESRLDKDTGIKDEYFKWGGTRKKRKRKYTVKTYHKK